MSTVSDQELENLKSLISAGLSLEAINAFLVYCAQHNKSAILKEIQAVIEKSASELTQPEKDDLKKFIDAALEQKISAFVEEYRKTGSVEDLNKLLAELKPSAI